MPTYDSKLEQFSHSQMPKALRIPSKQQPSVFQVTLVQNYNPDFMIKGKFRNIYVECKGRLDYEQQRKIAHLRPHERAVLKMVFPNVNARYNKLVRQSVWDWGNKLGIECITPQMIPERLVEWQAEADMPDDEWLKFKGLTGVDTTPTVHKRRTRKGV